MENTTTTGGWLQLLELGMYATVIWLSLYWIAPLVFPRKKSKAAK